MRRATSGKGFSYGAHTPPDPFADPFRSHALEAHPRPNALWLTSFVPPKRGRYASASITNALVVARAVCCDASVAERMCAVRDNLNLLPPPPPPLEPGRAAELLAACDVREAILAVTPC